MQFILKQETIRNTIGTNENQLKIPRYQRDYSWGKKEILQFLKDIINNITKEGKKIKASSYFFGTIILEGNINESQQILEVVDGQQRLCTITILLSALHKICEINNKDEKFENLKQKIFRKLMIDISGEKKKSICIETSGNFFDKHIYPNNEGYKTNVSDEETKLIKSAFETFEQKLEKENITKTFLEYSNLKVEKLEYFDLINTIFNQIMGSSWIVISALDKENINSIFESINSKGVGLSQTDLVKNKVFSYLLVEEPNDFAKEIWAKIKDNLSSENLQEYIKIDEFYYHYWIANNPKTTQKNLYNKFLEKTESKDYGEFIKELEEYSKIYNIILGGDRYTTFGKQDSDEIRLLLTTIFNFFNVKQPIILIMQLVRSYKKGIIKIKKLKTYLRYIADFHFVYNAICSQRTNVLERIYNKYANEIKKIIDSAETSKKVERIEKQMLDYRKEVGNKINDKEIYSENFDLKFSNEDYNKKENGITKYFLYRYSYELNGAYDSNLTVEHIYNESESKTEEKLKTIDLGNLILLESRLNNKAENKVIADKKEEYLKSSNKDMQEFLIPSGKVNYNNFLGSNTVNEKNETISRRRKEKIEYFWELKNKEFLNKEI